MDKIKWLLVGSVIMFVGCTNSHLSYMQDYGYCRSIQSNLNTGGYGVKPSDRANEIKAQFTGCMVDMGIK